MSGKDKEKSFWNSFKEYFHIEMRAAAENALMAPSQITIDKQEDILRRRVEELSQLKKLVFKSESKASSRASSPTPKVAEPKEAEPKVAEPKEAEPKEAEPKVAEPKVAELKASESKASTPKAASRSSTGSSIKSPVGLYDGGKRKKRRVTRRKKRLS